MVLHSVEDRDENADGALGVVAVGGGGLVGVLVGRSVLTAGKEGAGEVADGGYDYGEVVAAVPEAVVGGLIAEDLGDGGSVWMRERMWGGRYKHQTDDNGEGGDLREDVVSLS